MLSAIRKRITPGTVIATIALLFAMTGGAYAAKKYLITSTKQISPSVLKALKGKTGSAGASGAPGAAGPQGPAGPGGAAGAGTPGAPGANGTSVTSKTLAKGEGGCVEGGSEFTSASGKSAACNGEKGLKGTTGSPWTAGGTLPVGATETGAWTFGPIEKEGSFDNFVVASFTIPLAAALPGGEECQGPNVGAGCHVHFINPEGKEVTGEEGTEPVDPTKTGACLGSTTLPTATSGNLCIYAAAMQNVTFFGDEAIFAPGAGAGAGKTGATLRVILGGVGGVHLGEESSGVGTWAVTG
jgi:hypothetical protein